MALLSFPYSNPTEDFDRDPFHILTSRRHGGNPFLQNRESDLVRNFSPRFDVRESEEAYHLDGELPGINQKDIEIEFSDPHTLVIKGHSTRQYEQTNTEDEESAAPVPSEAGENLRRRGAPYKYWVSERSSGSFHRTFNFPLQVDQDSVKASLRNGILAVHVPKQTTKKPGRRIQVN